MAEAPSIFSPSNTPRAAWPRIWPRWILGLMVVGIAGAIYWTEQKQGLGLNVHATGLKKRLLPQEEELGARTLRTGDLLH